MTEQSYRSLVAALRRWQKFGWKPTGQWQFVRFIDSGVPGLENPQWYISDVRMWKGAEVLAVMECRR